MSTSERAVTVREGEALDLFCDSTTPYQVSGECKVYTCTVRSRLMLQWCYWAHNGSEYPTTSHKGGGELR